MKKKYDEGFTAKEISLIDNIIKLSISKNKLYKEKNLRKALK